ncbi:MAG: Asp-tRNA(Asn)/Glu-tRNA(Gln) amidotransferase subunit GatB, partial [archaeon]|nr:Asp-tRNA(Asn)/Glu-tRNA(Gln) amidotransferase subunit GatB [archaeon]
KSSKELGTKVEVKNLNSFRAVHDAIEFEIQRQRQLLDEGVAIIQETRGWDEKKRITFSQREKEEAHDYRYFPEPDLPLLRFEAKEIKALENELPELPQERMKRFIAEYSLTQEAAHVFVVNKDLGEYFEQVMSELGSKHSNSTANYLVTDLQGLLQGASVGKDDFLITAENFAELITLVAKKEISTPAAKTILKEMYETGADPSQIMENRGLKQVSNDAQLEKVAQEVVSANKKAVADYTKGKESALKFLVGQMMAKTKGAANPQASEESLKKVLLGTTKDS